MNILVVHNYYKIRAGEETVFENEVRLLRGHGHNVIIYTRDNRELDNMPKIKKLFLPLTTVFSLRTYKDIKRIIKKEKIDIVHVHNYLCLISPSVYYAAFNKNVPVVQTVHHFRLNCPATTLYREGKICRECVRANLFRAVKYKCYKNSFSNTLAVAFMVEFHKRIGTYKKVNFICLTDFNKKQLVSMNKIADQYINEKMVFIKPNFSPFSHEIIPYRKRKNQIIYAGRLYPTKGIKLLFEAWLQIDGYELIVCGTGPEEEWCKEFIVKNRIKNIKMMGVIKNTALAEYIAESKALILPTQWYEGFPMVLVESFACGTPVLGSDIGNVNDIIIEGVNGLHFKYNSVKDLVRAVNELYDMVETTKESSDKFYSQESNYGLLMDIYGRLKR